jgi:hypothetical protein
VVYNVQRKSENIGGSIHVAVGDADNCAGVLLAKLGDIIKSVMNLIKPQEFEKYAAPAEADARGKVITITGTQVDPGPPSGIYLPGTIHGWYPVTKEGKFEALVSIFGHSFSIRYVYTNVFHGPRPAIEARPLIKADS